MLMKTRSTEPELIDLGPGSYTSQEYEDCLVKLDQIGRWLGGDRSTCAALKRMEQPPDSILDVGCGGGLFTIRLALQYPKARVVGIDLNPAAIEFAKRRLNALPHPPSNLTFETRADGKLEEPAKSYDVVLSTLVCHHLSDEQLTSFFSSAQRIARKKVVINDLHRHPLALLLFKMTSPLLFRNRLVHHDGLLSIRKAFTREEFVNLFNQAGLRAAHYSIKRRWAFRWLVEIYPEELLP